MRFHAVVFDLDGTLLDSLADIAAAMNRVLTARALPTHPLPAYRGFIGDGSRLLAARALPPKERSEALVSACLAEFKAEYGRSWDRNTVPYDGICDLLTALTERGLKLAVLSNKPHAFTVLCVERLLADWKFDAILGQNERLPMKPDPAGAFEVAALVGLPPASFLYLGDSGVDMQTARAAGMFAVGACWGLREPEELRRHGGQVLVRHPRQVLDLL